MSKENVEIVRSICAPWTQGDFSSADWADPEIEYEIADGPAAGRWTGLLGLAEGWRSFLSAWENYTAEAEDYIELDDERILVPLRNTGQGKTSGLDIGQIRSRGANLFHIRGGKVTRLVTYMDREDALKAAGLSESDRQE
jgi:ketosteroid isomerase-like protein